ncbi:MAG: malonic semialdehyde reductase [Pseudomonadota bacterium]
MNALPPASLDQLFLQARTPNAFLATPVPVDLLKEVYALARMGPTGMNTQPARYLFLLSAASRERLRPALSAGNVEKTMKAPVTVVIAWDTRFYEFMPQIWHGKGAMESFAADPAMAAATATKNGTLAGAYFMLAARSLGLDCGPMGGFDAAKVNAEFFADGRWQANFLLNLGYADKASIFPRNGRLAFEQACTVL